MEGKVLEVNNLTKTYGSKGFQTKVLKGISLSICERDLLRLWDRVAPEKQRF